MDMVTISTAPISVAEEAVIALARYFAVEQEIAPVFAAAFEWYYVPQSTMRRAWAARVLAEATRDADLCRTNTFPNWFWRVYELCVLGQSHGMKTSIPPPL